MEPHTARAERSRGEADDRLKETDSLAACLWLFQGGLKTVPAGMPCMVLCREKKPTQEMGEGTSSYTDTHLCTLVIYKRFTKQGGHEPNICKCTHAQIDNRQLRRHTGTQGFHWTPSYKPNTCTNTHIHNLCKWAPEAPWHVADAQFSCPHPVSRPNQSSPLHTGQQHGRRLKITLMTQNWVFECRSFVFLPQYKI